MKFLEQTRPDYPEIGKWLVSENGAFAICVLNYLFGLKCIQIEHGENNEWYVIQEWRTYKPELVEPFIQRIRDDLASLEATFGEWKKVEDRLPPRKEKYLEEEPWALELLT